MAQMRSFRDCLGSSLLRGGLLLSGDHGFSGNWLWLMLASLECGFMLIFCNERPRRKCGHPFNGAGVEGRVQPTKYVPAGVP